MDGVDGRHLLNRLAAFYLLPYFDVVIKLEADDEGRVSEAYDAVHYVKPDSATLQDRKLYAAGQLKAAGLRRIDSTYRQKVAAGYIRGIAEDCPAVISINMQMVSTAVNKFLGRLHPYRYDYNAESATVRKIFIFSRILGSLRKQVTLRSCTYQ